jgi:hypothetical protein
MVDVPADDFDAAAAQQLYGTAGLQETTTDPASRRR